MVKRFTIRSLLFVTACVCIFTALLVSWAKQAEGDEAHFFGVGSEYSIEEFGVYIEELDASFEFTEPELRRLEKEWKRLCFDVFSELHGEIRRNFDPVSFCCRLSDGYEINSAIRIGRIDRETYMQMQLVTSDRSTYQPEVNFLRITLDGVLDLERLKQLEQELDTKFGDLSSERE